MSKIKNPEIRDSLLNLSEFFFKLYQGNIGYDFTYNNQVFTQLLQSNEYIIATEKLSSYPVIKKHLNQQVGHAALLIMLDIERVIKSFLTFQKHQNPNFEVAVFSKCFSDFEDFFYGNNITKVETCRLSNFDCELNEVELSPNFKIKKFPNSKKKSIENMFDSDFVLEKISNLNKIVGDLNESSLIAVSDTTSLEFDNIISIIRLLKPSSVFRNSNVVQSYNGYFQHLASGLIYGSIFENTVVGAKCVLSKTESEELKNIWGGALNLTNDKKFNLSLSRLSYAVQRTKNVDRILDIFIALESLYLPDSEGELSFKLALRAGIKTQTDSINKEKCYKFLKKMYGLRSKIAHGRTVDVKPEELSELENILRISIKLYLSDPNSFNIDSLDTSYF